MTQTETETDAVSDHTEENRFVVDEYIQYIRGKKADSTVTSRKKHLLDFMSWAEENGKQITNLDQWDFEEYIDQRLQENSSNYTLTLYKSVSLLYSDWIIGQQDRLKQKYGVSVPIDDDPTEGIRDKYNDLDSEPLKAKWARDDIVALSAEEAKQMVQDEYIPDPLTRNKLLLKLLIQTGVRRGEAQGIRIQDINREQRSIKIRGEKTSDNRTVFYQPSLDPLLERWLDRGMRIAHSPPADSDRLFVTQRSEKLSKRRINDIVKITADNAGVQEILHETDHGKVRKVTAHCLRHTMSRIWVERGGDIARLAKILGHTDKEGKPNLDTTRKYLRAFGDDTLRDAADQYGPTL